MASGHEAVLVYLFVLALAGPMAMCHSVADYHGFLPGLMLSGLETP